MLPKRDKRYLGFNPTMVRLLPIPFFVGAVGLLVVSIPQWCDCCLVVNEQRREEIMRVSIPQWCDCCPLFPFSVLTKTFTFQSHNGAIAASSTNAAFNPAKEFQSHNGAIAAGFNAFLRTTLIGFNPTMVRLLPSAGRGALPIIPKFQSHNGAIAATKLRTSKQAGGRSFNPTMVRLLPR